MKTHLTYVLLSLLVVAVISTAPLAQEPADRGTIDLEVRDPSGAGVPNAQVQLLLSVGNLGTDLSTDKIGKMSAEVPAGSYELRVKQPGFVLAKKHIDVLPGARLTIPVELRLGGCPPGPCGIVTNLRAVSFPEESKAVSPDGRYAVVSEGNNSFVHPYRVFLEDLSLKKRRQLFAYSGRVVVLWNGLSNLIAVTFYMGNDNSRSSIFSVDGASPPAQAVDLLLSNAGKSGPGRERLESLLNNEHVHVVTYQWVGGSELLVSLYAYGAANPAGISLGLNSVTYVNERR